MLCAVTQRARAATGASSALARRMSARLTGDPIATLESLLSISVADRALALVQASDLVARALHADKVDAFLYDGSRDTLVAVGSSTQPLSALQKKHGLDVLPVANGGRTVEVYRTGVTYACGRADEDPEELRGIKETLRVRSEIAVGLDVAGRRRGVLLLASQQADLWSAEDVRFTEAVARWVGAVVRQAELVEQLEASALEAGRRSAAEELVTVLAHDLRHFIYPVDLGLQVLQRRAERDARAEDVRDAARSRRSLARLNALVNDILDVARIEQGFLTIEARSVALVPLLEELAGSLSTSEHPVVVVAREEVTAQVDPVRFRQCIENLTTNAITHSPRLTPVTITVSCFAGDDGRMARVDVADQGPGVAPEIAPHIFERFVTGPQRRRGLGLGLYLARQIVLMHHGDLTVNSAPDKGARFTVTVPCGVDG